jgi:UDP-GlcNAc:undecaprenyl-phosphate/decaprenyl-phosphate GlcNAc-1-phosphate transferase
MHLLLALIIAMVVTMALIPPLARAAGRLQVLDAPSGRKVHVGAMPRIGGIAMVVGSLVPLWFWLPMDSTLRAYLLAVLVLLLFGIWDDRVALSAPAKFAGQLIAVLIIIIAGHVSIDSLVLGNRVTLPGWLGFSLTLLFLLGITNAINLADGLDGLAGGMTLLCCAALVLLGENWGVRFVATVGVVLIGALVGFLRFNSYPARIFMGDAGSQFLGFSVGVLSILLTQHAATPLSTALPLLLIGLPFLDTLAVMAIRLREGRSPFTADRKHVHHRLMALGLDQHEAVVVIYAVQCLLLVVAWQLRFENDLVIVAVFFGSALLLIGTFMLLEHTGWRWRLMTELRERSVLARIRNWLATQQRLARWSCRSSFACAALYLVGVATYARPVPTDIGWLVLLTLLPLAAGALWRRSPLAQTWAVRSALYVIAFVAVYLDHSMPVHAPELQTVKWVVLPLLVVSVGITIRLSGQRRFEATPLDLLLIFAAIALPNLPGLEHAPHDLGLSIAKLVALCYAVEMISVLGARLRTSLLGAGAVFCVLVALRAFA